MEENAALENFDMKLNETAKGFLKETAKWAYFLSILGYIGIGFIVVAAVFAGTIFAAMGKMGGGMDGGMHPMGSLGGTFITILYLVIAVLYFFPVYYLNKFASNMKAAFRDNNTESLTTSFEYLKSHYKFIGILTLVIFAIYALIFVIAIVAGIAAFAS
ncbi:DUF5362 family protein [Flavobacterium sp.]|uniref:DUF5362 family protein n=1 Tax=Flavobacterium sp. TaxID=239 RepID=UPI002B4B1AFD|nr:DUF5362 family protein [Flavobacterium sp.]HLF53040.1 DUF5362 family protein [Flavobacterium sp.]